MTRTTIAVAAALGLAVMLPDLPAQAQVARTFVSAAGSDSNNCANIATPCRHFQTAVTATAPGGEIVALDPANYGSMTINHQITVNGQGWAYVGPQNGGNAITITAGSNDNVTIHGVVLDGIGATGGTNGIVFNTGGSLTVTNCVAQNFNYLGNNDFVTGNGILIQPTSGAISFVITDTNVSNNGYGGISYIPQSGSPTANGIIDHVVATNNYDGIQINTNVLGGGQTTVAISNSIASNNSVHGVIVANSGAFPLAVSIDNTTISGNKTVGIAAFNTTNVTLGRSVITANATGLDNETSPNTFYSYQDNRLNGNNPDYSGPVPNTHALR